MVILGKAKEEHAFSKTAKEEEIIYEDTRKCYCDDHRSLGAQANSIYLSNKISHRKTGWVAVLGSIVSLSVPVVG